MSQANAALFPMSHPLQNEVQRSLAAIVMTDAVGFSKRMSRDEDTALRMINQDIHLISTLCQNFEGKILKTTGDGVLMYFISAVQAVSCAIEIQKQFAELSQCGGDGLHFAHRVGVHLGDIFFNHEDIMGTAVNIAARLESEAKPGGVCLSQVAYEVVKSRLDLDAIYAGQLSLKNIEEYVAAYHVVPASVQMEEVEVFPDMTIPLVVPLNNVLKILSAHPESAQIKELLYAAHQGELESGSTALANMSLKLLLESLTEQRADLVECRHALSQTINELGLARSYTQIAEIILISLEDYYLEEELLQAETPPELDLADNISGISEESDVVEVPETSDASEETIQQPVLRCQRVSDSLGQAQNKTQVKKLLYYICCQTWESHDDRIEAIPMLSLVQELHRTFPDMSSLQDSIDMSQLSSDLQAAYTPVVLQVLSECSLLYREDDSFSSIAEASLQTIRCERIAQVVNV